MKFNLIGVLSEFYKNYGKFNLTSLFNRTGIQIKYGKAIEYTLCLVVVLVSFLLLNQKFVADLFEEYFPAAEEETDKIDWHDWELIKEDEIRSAIGEHGDGAYLPMYPPSSKLINDTHGFNGHLSDKIALNRALKDLRPPE